MRIATHGRRMPYLIDGHNLVPLLGLRLSDAEDEAQAARILLRYFARTARSGTVYFDQRAPGSAPGRSSRHLVIRFVAPPRTADDAIRAHLSRLRREARNWIVVSNDQAVRRATQLAGARWLSATAFAREVRSAASAGSAEKSDAPVSAEEVAEYERLFRDRSRGEHST